MNTTFSFNNPPLDNIAFLMAKKPELHFDYDEIQFEAHQRAFTVAKVTQIDLLAEIQASLENAFVEGQGYNEWIKELKPTLQKAGWLGKSVEVTNPKTGEKKMIEVGSSRLKRIFYTNARTAYAQSEARAGYKLPLSEYIRYVAILDNRTRVEHRAFHGKIAHRDDAFWKKNYPPNGWNCRCSVEFISKDEMEEQGWNEMSEAEKTLNFAHKDWDYDTRNLSSNDENLLLIIKNKIEKYAKNPPAMQALEKVRKEIIEQRKRYEAIKELWAKNASAKDEFVNLGKISEFLSQKTSLKEELRLYWQTMEDHRNPNITRVGTHENIKPFEYSLIPFMLEKSFILGIYQDAHLGKKNKDTYIIASKLKRTFRLTLRKESGYINVSSLVSDENALKRIFNDKKREIYATSEMKALFEKWDKEK